MCLVATVINRRSFSEAAFDWGNQTLCMIQSRYRIILETLFGWS